MRGSDSERRVADVDLSELRLIFDGDPEALASFCVEIADAIETASSELGNALARGEWSAARAKAHEVRGLCGNAGARSLAASYGLLEARVVEDGDAATAAFREIAPECDAVCERLRHGVDASLDA